MSELETLHLSLTKFLEQNHWVVDNGQSTSNTSLWSNKELNETILVPTTIGLNHRRAEKTLTEAVYDLADICSTSIPELREKLHSLISTPFDQIHFRAMGNAIPHGKINFRTNHKIENAIYSLINHAVKKYIDVDKHKQKLQEEYLDSVNYTVPQAGSYIYNLEVDLHKDSSIEEGESLQRYVNHKLAQALEQIHTINVNDATPTRLFQSGLNASICSGFIGLFDRNVESIECSFDWSASEPQPNLTSNKIVFNRSHLEKAQKFKKAFESSRAIPLKGVMAHIKRIDIHEHSAEIRLKLEIENRSRTCTAQIDLDMAQRLLQTLGENIEQAVMIDATAWVVKTAYNHNYVLSDITSICTEKGKNLSLFSVPTSDKN